MHLLKITFKVAIGGRWWSPHCSQCSGERYLQDGFHSNLIDYGIPDSQLQSIQTHVAEGAAETLAGKVVVDVLITELKADV